MIYMITNYFIKPHFPFVLILAVSTTLHACSCIKLAKKIKKPNTSEISHERNAYKTLKNHLPPAILYTESCTKSAKSNKKYSTGNAETTYTNNAQDNPTSKTAIQPIPLRENRVNQTGSRQTRPSLRLQGATLTKEMPDQVEQAFSTPSGTLLAHVGDIEIRQEDLIRLKGSSWLNDNIINAYMCMINKRTEEKENHSLPKVYAFNTYFFTNLDKKGYQSVKRWTKK